MLAIMVKDLKLAWITFRKLGAIAILALILGLSGLALWMNFGGTAEPGIETTASYGLYANKALPEEFKNDIDTTFGTRWKLYEDRSELRAAIADRELLYGLDLSNPNQLVVYGPSRASAESFLGSSNLNVELDGTPYEVITEVVSGQSAARSAALVIWLAFVALSVVGSNLCNILVWEERAKGSLEELVASPATRLQIVLGKVAAVLISALLVSSAGLAIVGIFLTGSVFVVWSSAYTGADATANPQLSDVANSLLSMLDPGVVASIVATGLFALLLMTTLLVVANFLVKEQAMLKFGITPVMALVFAVPFLIDSTWTSSGDPWAVPIANLYTTAVHSFSGDPHAAHWWPSLMVNAGTWLVVVLVGAYLVSRIQDWPAR